MGEWWSPSGAAALRRFVSGEPEPDPSAPLLSLQRREFTIFAIGTPSRFGGIGYTCEWRIDDPTAPIMFAGNTSEEFRNAAELERKKFFKEFPNDR
jgi:hypothetical protein